MQFLKDVLEKAKAAETAEQLLEIAKAEGVELTAEEAEMAFAQLHKAGELADEELDNVTGGIRCDSTPTPVEEADREEDVVYAYKIGQSVEVYQTWDSTKRATVTRQYAYKTNNGRYCPGYEVKFSDGTTKEVRQSGIEKP